jgi:predicted nucleotidyltransferase component of viral defense system
VNSSWSIREDIEWVHVESADLSAAPSEGFEQATAEKVVRLLGLLREVKARGSTKDRYTLKGGTALNVFHLSNAPRLSVDLDLMTTGFPGSTPESRERAQLIRDLRALVEALDYRVSEERGEAGVTLSCSYRNSLGSSDRIKIDLDLLNRTTLLPADLREGPALFVADDMSFPVLSEPELLGQKLTAVAYRAAPRDLFDMDVMLTAGWHNKNRARAMYLAYSFLQDHDWYRLDYPVKLDVPYRQAQLADVLRGETRPPHLDQLREHAKDALERANPPFTSATDREQELRRALLGGESDAFGEIAGEHDRARRSALAKHPGLAWRLLKAARPEARKRSV